MKSAGKARNNGLYRHIRTSKEIIRNLLNDFFKYIIKLQSSMQSGRFSAGYFIYSNSINYYKMVSVPEMVR